MDNKLETLSVLTANVGNLSFRCRKYFYNLCYKDVEDRIAENVRALQPEIVAFQELLAPWQCESFEQNHPKILCSEEQKIPQVRRILGEDYSIVCDQRWQFTCIALRVDKGEIIGCKPGGLCNIARTSREITGCDNGFTISAVTVLLNNGYIFDVVNAHPQSTDAKCRAKMLSQIFGEGTVQNPLVIEDKVLLIGDYNLDPWRDKDESVTLWNDMIEKGWKGKELRYHSGIAEKNPPRFTSFLLHRRKTVDLVISNFADGVCQVLGETPYTNRLDGGKGTDHRAVFGILSILK